MSITRKGSTVIILKGGKWIHTTITGHKMKNGRSYYTVKTSSKKYYPTSAIRKDYPLYPKKRKK